MFVLPSLSWRYRAADARRWPTAAEPRPSQPGGGALQSPPAWPTKAPAPVAAGWPNRPARRGWPAEPPARLPAGWPNRRRAAGGLAEPPAADGGLSEPPPAPGGWPNRPVPPAGAEPPAGRRLAEPAGAAAPAASRERSPATRGWWIGLAVGAFALVGFYALLSFQRLEIFKMLLASFFPLLVLILAVLGSIVIGLATPTEAAAVGALGGFLLAVAYRQLNLTMRQGESCS